MTRTEQRAEDAYRVLDRLANLLGWETGRSASELYLGDGRYATSALLVRLERHGWAERHQAGMRRGDWRITEAGRAEYVTQRAQRRAAMGTVTVPRWAVEDAVRRSRPSADVRAAFEQALKEVPGA